MDRETKEDRVGPGYETVVKHETSAARDDDEHTSASTAMETFHHLGDTENETKT